MAAQKRPSQRSKYLASASTMDHARHGFLPRHRDTGILDSLGRFFGSDRGAPKRGSGKVPWLKQSKSPLGPHARSPPGLCNMYQDGHHAARTTHYGSLPQKAQHGRPQDENPVVHFFKNIVTPRTPPPSQGKGAEGQKPGFGYGGRASDYKSAHKGLKGRTRPGLGGSRDGAGARGPQLPPRRPTFYGARPEGGGGAAQSGGRTFREPRGGRGYRESEGDRWRARHAGAHSEH
uniref:Myelin basic protein n=1 Tax=Bos taurus TaxID=9913 RepID=A0ABI0P6E6_BOVIN